MGTHSQEQITLLSDYDAESKYSTAYHAAFLNIRFNWKREEHPYYAILLTTPAPYSGQAIVPANIAIAAAQNGTPTLLVDADLCSPGRLQQRFGTNSSMGLGELLEANPAANTDLERYVSPTFIPSLYLLGTGAAPRSSSESRTLLSSRLTETLLALRRFLQENDNQPGLIIFNSPPVLSGTDAALIGTQVDQTFLTIATGRTTQTQARRAQEQLERAQVRPAGVILVDI